MVFPRKPAICVAVWKILVVSITFVLFIQDVAGIPQQADRQQALHHLFQSLDKDGDGQVEAGEVLKYIQVRQDSSDLRVDGEHDAAQHFMSIDSNDGDATVSEQELLRSLTNKLSVRIALLYVYLQP